MLCYTISDYYRIREPTRAYSSRYRKNIRLPLSKYLSGGTHVTLSIVESDGPKMNLTEVLEVPKMTPIDQIMYFQLLVVVRC
jgi:hypothetical protein